MVILKPDCFTVAIELKAKTKGKIEFSLYHVSQWPQNKRQKLKAK